MPCFKNRLNHRYGRLFVTAYAGITPKGQHMWHCKCDCGKDKIVSSNNLSSGKSNSCGCLLTEFLLALDTKFERCNDRELSILKVQYNHIKRRHLKFRGILFSLDAFIYKARAPCYYCGLEYSKELSDRLGESKKQRKLSTTILKINGIDRLDSSIGYTENNTVSCCKYCNTAKHLMTEVQFLNWINRVYKYQKSIRKKVKKSISLRPQKIDWK